MTLTKTQAALLGALIVTAPATFQWREMRRAEAQNRQTTEALTRLRTDINERQRGISALERRLRRIQAVEASGRQAGDRAPNAGTARDWYAWDEQSDFVRLPRQYANHFRYAGFDTRTVARRKEREQRQAIARDGTPSPVLLDALGADAPTRAQLSEALQEACNQVQNLVSRQSYLTNRQPLESSESVTLRTEASPAEGAALRDGLRASLVNLLGQERAELVMQQGSQVFRDAWSDFGSSPHQVTIWRAPDGSVQAREDLYDAEGALRGSRQGGASGDFVPISAELRPCVDAWTFDGGVETALGPSRAGLLQPAFDDHFQKCLNELGASTRVIAFGKDPRTEFPRVMVADENRRVWDTRLLNPLNVPRSLDDPVYYYARLLGIELPQPVETGQ